LCGVLGYCVYINHFWRQAHPPLGSSVALLEIEINYLPMLQNGGLKCDKVRGKAARFEILEFQLELPQLQPQMDHITFRTTVVVAAAVAIDVAVVLAYKTSAEGSSS